MDDIMNSEKDVKELVDKYQNGETDPIRYINLDDTIDPSPNKFLDNINQVKAQEGGGFQFPYQQIANWAGQHKTPLIATLLGIGGLSYFLNKLKKPKEEGLRIPNKKIRRE